MATITIRGNEINIGDAFDENSIIAFEQLCQKIDKVPVFVFQDRVIFTDGTSINNLKAFIK